jgi:hypothetical protein
MNRPIKTKTFNANPVQAAAGRPKPSPKNKTTVIEK